MNNIKTMIRRMVELASLGDNMTPVEALEGGVISCGLDEMESFLPQEYNDYLLECEIEFNIDQDNL